VDTTNLTAGTSFNFVISENAQNNNTTMGILVGSSNDSNGVDTYALQSQIIDSDLYHKHSCLKSVPYLDGSDFCFRTRRSFTNITQGNITIREIAMYLNNSIYSYMIYRVVVPDIVVPSTQTIEITLNIRCIF